MFVQQDRVLVAPYVSLDFETYSEAGYVYTGEKWRSVAGGQKGGLPAVGAEVYARDPSTEVLMACYQFGPGADIYTWVPGYGQPDALLEHVANGGLVHAYNSMFEWLIWEHVCRRLYGWPELPLANTRDSMAVAQAYGLPGKLENAAMALGLPQQKDKGGIGLIRRFSVPKQPTKNNKSLRHYIGDDPENAYRFYSYCAQDVRTEAAVAAACPPLSPYELEVWKLDQEINARGMAVDREALENCRRLVAGISERLTRELVYLTNGRVTSPGQVAEIPTMLAEYGINIGDLQAETVEAVLKNKEHVVHQHPWAVRVLEIRRDLASASVKKLEALNRRLCDDGRVRGLLQYCGAERTGRWAGRGPQPQNLPRGDAKVVKCLACKTWQGPNPQCCACGGNVEKRKWNFDCAVQALESFRGCDVDVAIRRWGDVLAVIAGCLRSLFVAAPGKRLICSDYSAIEAVVLAALAGEEWRLEVFRTHGKIYEMSAAKITGRSIEEYMEYKRQHDEHHPDRQKIGKVAELACFGADTQVLTDSGWKRIVDVTTDDKLHDGVEWVEHGGVVSQGERTVIEVDGVQVTPDHRFYAGASTWITAADFQGSTLYQRQVRDTASWLLKNAFGPKKGTSTCSVDVLAEIQAPRSSGTCARVVPPVVIRAAKRLPLNQTVGMQTCAPTGSIGAGFSTVCLRRFAGVLTRHVGSTQFTEDVESRSTPRGFKIGDNGWHTFARFRGGMTLGPLSTGLTTITGMSPGTLGSLHYRNSSTTSSKPFGWNTTASVFRLLSFIASTLRISPTHTQWLMPCVEENLPRKLLRGHEVEVFDVTNVGPRSRFVIRTDAGPLIVHNSGYQGWVGAWKNFGADEHMSDEEIKRNVIRWREESPAIVAMWRRLEWAAIQALKNPGYRAQYRDISYHYDGKVLRCILPSGRALVYHQPRIVMGERHGRRVEQVTFWGWNSNPKYGRVGWIEQKTYGGRLTENIVQAASRDIMAHGLLNLKRAGYHPVLHVHDEAVNEEEEGFGSVEEVERLMGDLPPWARGWPVKAKGGWMGRAYRKD